jgi:hypothetical protein
MQDQIHAIGQLYIHSNVLPVIWISRDHHELVANVILRGARKNIVDDCKR